MSIESTHSDDKILGYPETFLKMALLTINLRGPERDEKGLYLPWAYINAHIY